MTPSGLRLTQFGHVTKMLRAARLKSRQCRLMNIFVGLAHGWLGGLALIMVATKHGVA